MCKQKPNSLSNREILDAFPDEILDIVPTVIKELEERLEPLKQQLREIVNSNYTDFDKTFLCRVVTLNSGLENDVNRLQELKKLYKIASLKPSDSKEDFTEKVLKAKQFPIKELYSFEKQNLYGNKIRSSCPFHTDKTPSFYIYKTNTFHCFSCGASGDSIAFFMKLHNKKFVEAVNALQ